METAMTHILEALEKKKGVDRQHVSEEAYRIYFNLHPDLKLEGVLTLYQEAEVSMGRAAELLGITIVEFKELLAARGISRESEGKLALEMDAKLRGILGI